MRLEHVAFNVPDAPAMAEWYVAHLGMRIARSIPDPPYIHFLADSSGQSLLEIYSDPLGEYVDYAAYHPVTFHLAFAVDDMEATRRRLAAAGGTLDGDVYETPAGDRLAFVRDPWGYAVQLVQRQSPLLD